MRKSFRILQAKKQARAVSFPRGCPRRSIYVRIKAAKAAD